MNDNIEINKTAEGTADGITPTSAPALNDAKAGNAKREPLFHISKRASLGLGKAIGIRVTAILIALAFAGLITLLILKQNPIVAYATMFKGVFGANTMVSLRSTAILLCIALALTPAFKMRFWNTGAEGQVLMGALATSFCMYYFYELPTAVLVTLMIAAALITGAIWGVIPAIFKALFGTNETLFTLMMNSIAACLTLFMMKFWSLKTGNVDKEILDPQGKINQIFGNNYFIVIATVLTVCALMYVYLKYSKHGYEISVVGESENTAKYVGINVRKVIIRTMAISGLLCGLTGFLIVAPAQNISSTIVGGQGFTAIMVAWLAKFNPIVMILSAFLFIFVSSGGREISTMLKVEAAYSDILIGILLFFIIGCEFFVNYELSPTARGTALATKIKKFFAPVANFFKKIAGKISSFVSKITSGFKKGEDK